MARGHTNYQFRDYSNELSTTALYMNDIVDGAAYTAALTRIASMQTLIAGLSIGVLARETVIAIDDSLGAGLPASAFAQRELKWFVPYYNSATAKKGSFTIPCAKLDGGLLIPSSDLADLSNAAWVNFLAEIQNPFWSPNEDEEGNYLIGQPYVVGRNI